MKSRPAHFERLLNFLRRKGRSHEDAEDLIQEAMLRLHRYRRTDQRVVNEEAFLTTAVQNLSVDLHRRFQGRHEVPLELSLAQLVRRPRDARKNDRRRTAPQPYPRTLGRCQRAHARNLLRPARRLQL